jgi:hypothetical protein
LDQDVFFVRAQAGDFEVRALPAIRLRLLGAGLPFMRRICVSGFFYLNGFSYSLAAV